MNSRIVNILRKLTENNDEAYIVGGYVRELILGNESFDVDIATNILPKDIKEIMGLSSSNEDNYGSIRFKDSLYNYDITTFRTESKYVDRHPINYQFSQSINEDVLRRDFTINALYMDQNGRIIDLVNGQADLNNGIIRCIGNISDKMMEDPLRMLRAIRFASKLNFTIEPQLYEFIKNNKILLSKLSYTRKKDELQLIFQGTKGVELIKSLDLENVLEIKIPDELIPTKNVYGIWAQIEFSKEYPFSSKEVETISSIQKIIQYGTIDNMILYQYGIYSSIIAAEILGKYRSYVSDIYASLPIYSVKDIQITGDEIMNLLNIEPGEKIKNIIQDIEFGILNHEINNSKEELKQYILRNWR